MRPGDKVRVGFIDCARGVHYVSGVVASTPDAKGRVKVRLREGEGSKAADLRLGRAKNVFLRGHGEVKLKSNDGRDENRMKYGSLYVA